MVWYTVLPSHAKLVSNQFLFIRLSVFLLLDILLQYLIKKDRIHICIDGVKMT